MSSIRERLGLNDVEQKKQTFSIRERLGITQESLEEEKNNQEIQQRIKEENSIVQSRKKTGLKWIDKNLKNIDAKTYENAQNLSDYQNDNSAIKLGSTVGDLAVNVGKGFVGGVEGAVDIGRYGVAGIADLLGAKNYANDVRERAKQNTTDILFSPIENTFDKNSLLKKNGLIENVAQGIGQIGAIVGGGGLLPKAISTVNVGKFAMPTTSILTGAGSAMTEAYNNGATNGQALAAGIGGGLVEGFSESLFDGLGSTFSKKFGGGALDDVIVKRLTDKISNKTLQTLAQSGLKATGEGFEEVISGIGNAITKKLTYMNNEDIGKLINDEDLLNSFVVGTLTSAVAQTPSTINSIKTGKSYINLDEESKIDNNKINNQNKVSDNLLNENENRYSFLPTNNEKSNNLKQSASKYFNNSQDTANLVNTFDKIAREKNYNILFDDTIKNSSGNFVNAQIKSLSNGEVEIRINPNSNRAGEFLIMHEVTHAIETDSMKKLIIDYASNNSEFSQALESLKQTYGTSDISSEVVADISGQLFGNQEFINNLSTKQPNIFKKIYNKIIELANKITGNTKESLFIKDLKNKWETAYRNTTDEQAINNLKNDTKSSKGKLISGEDVIVSDDINGSHPSKQIAEQNLKSMLGIKYLNSSNNTEISIENKDIKKYLNDGYNNQKNMKLKKRISGNYGEILEIAQIDPSKSQSNYKGTNRGKQGFDYYDVNIAYPVKDNNGNIINYKYYESRLVVRKDNNNNFAYDLDGFKEKKGAVLDKASLSIMADKSADGSFSTDNISQSNENVKSDTLPKYSMQNNENNTQELDNSSFSILKNSNGKEIDISDLKENLTMERFHYNRKYDKNNIVTYRGESDNTGSNPAFYGLGLYTTLDSKYAKKYGNVFVVDSSLLPDNPLKFKTQNDFNIWEQELARELGIRKSELYSDDYGVEQYIKKLGYDGLMIGTGKDTDLISYKDVAIKYSQQNDKWQEHLEKNYKATGTRTNMKSLELPTVNKETKVTNKADILPKYSDVNNITKQNLLTIKELNAMKYENNKNAIGRLEQEKNKTIRNINSKIKSKITEYNSKQNKNTIVANKLNQQIAVLNNQKQNIEAEYNKKINNLKLKNEKMTTIEFKTKEQKMSKKQEYDQLALSNIENMKTWKDKDKGIKYKTNTMDRNFYDIIPNKNEAKRIVDTYISPITENNAKREKFITKYNKRIEALNLNEKESIAVQMLGEAKYIEAINDKAMFASEIIQTADEYIEKNKLSKDKIQNAVNEFRKVYDELYTEVNMVLKEQGFKEIEYRKNYFPHFEETTPTSKIGKLAEKLGWKFSNNEIPTSIAGITDTFRPNRIWTSFTQKRYGNHTSYNALKGFDNYIRGASDLIFHTEDIQKLRSLENMIRYQYSEKSIQEEYDNITNMDLDNDSKSTLIDDLFEKVDNPLGNLVTELRSYTDDLANKKSELDRRIEHSIGRQYYNTAKNIQNRLSANMVGLNISSALTNFIPITQAWGQVSTKNLIRGMKQSISNGLREDGLVDNSVFLTNRTKQADRLYKTNLEKISNKVNIIFDTVDSFTANTIVRAKYLDNLEKGMNRTQAMENADKFAKSIMAGRDKGSLPTIFNSKNPIIKLFTSFQLEVANQYNYMLKDIPMDLKKEGLLKLTSAFLKMFLGAWIYNKVSESIIGRKSAFSPIDIISETVDEFKKDTSTYNKLSSTTTNLVSELPFVGGILGGGRLPISSALPNLGTTIESFTKLGDDNKRQSAIKNLKKELSKPLFYIVMPFGGGQMKKTIEGLSMYDKNLPTAGSYTNSGNLRFTADESIGGKIKSALFGQYSSKEAQDYIDSGYKSISKNKIQEMKDLNMTSSEYKKFSKEMTDATKTTDSNNYKLYTDGENNYWYDESNGKVYDSNYRESSKTIQSLKKVSSKQLKFDYINSLNLNNEMKNKILNSNYGGNITDNYGYTKYVKKGEYIYSNDGLQKYKNENGTVYWVNKKTGAIYNSSGKLAKKVNKSKLSPVTQDLTYWYDDKNNQLYDSDYNKVDNSIISSLDKDTKDIDINVYNNYSSYDEYKFATDNPKEYNLINNFSIDYNKFNDIKSEVNDIKSNSSSINKKENVFKYINSLNYNKVQKMMLYKTLGNYSIKNYKKEMYEYIEGLKISKEEKETIWNQLYGGE